MAITRRQKEVLDWISEFIKTQGYSPSYAEIGRGLGMTSLATVHKHITNLRNKSLLATGFNRSRSIEIKNFCPQCGQKVRRRRLESVA